jgi:hypothetical protein
LRASKHRFDALRYWPSNYCFRVVIASIHQAVFGAWAGRRFLRKCHELASFCLSGRHEFFHLWGSWSMVRDAVLATPFLEPCLAGPACSISPPPTGRHLLCPYSDTESPIKTAGLVYPPGRSRLHACRARRNRGFAPSFEARHPPVLVFLGDRHNRLCRDCRLGLRSEYRRPIRATLDVVAYYDTLLGVLQVLILITLVKRRHEMIA